MHPFGTPRGLLATTGPIATAAWLVARELYPKEPKWRVEIALGVSEAPPPADLDESTTRFDLEIYAEEWGFRFCHQGRVSWIRVTDVPFVHGRDDHELFRRTPSLKEIANLVHELERRYEIRFSRDRAAIRTTIDDGVTRIREWLETL